MTTNNDTPEVFSDGARDEGSSWFAWEAEPEPATEIRSFLPIALNARGIFHSAAKSVSSKDG